MRGRRLLFKKPLPSRSLPKKVRLGGRWGERSLLCEKRLSPQTPLSRRAAGVWRDTKPRSWFRLRVGVSPIGLVEVTAADRAAATMLRLRRLRREVTVFQPLHSLQASKLTTFPTLDGRGGSISRRDLSHPAEPPRPTRRRNQVRETAQLKRQPLFGRGARGRGFSQRSRLPRNPRHPPPSLRGRGPGEGLLCKRSPSPGVPHSSK